MSVWRPALIDTHAHLDDDQFAGDVGDVLKRAGSVGVARVINVGYRPKRWKSTLALANSYPEIAHTLGLHPHHVEEWSPPVEAELEGLLVETSPVAVGEIGLDFYRNLNPPKLQRVVFERQLSIAVKFHLPVVIHQRAAEADLMDVLACFPSDLVCILHSFDGTRELVEFGTSRGYYFGVGGLMTRASSSDLRTVLSTVPLSRLLLETDSPYLTPAGVKIRRNEPATCTFVADRLAELLQVEVQTLAHATTANAERVFGPLLPSSQAAHKAGL